MKIIFGLIVASVLVFGGYLFFQVAKSDQGSAGVEQLTGNNVTVVDGKQIVEIVAKGGYTPRISTVKAGIPTVLRFDTNGTFDCTSQVRIPSMNIRQALPPSGVTDVPLGTLQAGAVQGTCGMGMYPFQINVAS